jgi:hypothetical protein
MEYTWWTEIQLITVGVIGNDCLRWFYIKLPYEHNHNSHFQNSTNASDQDTVHQYGIL